ncbi:MAG: PorV/PorQ family protein [Bacteroidetes Order II. Incertae sedis bacterium]|jgi:long-subunit fatty acid transport protein|nr:PorV/PorQ family protein [Bacteroidetes Order II. bacterium]MBT4053451.1 PorV/PorQ family protein [Bacteroidetes Order II. bacterium]MBT4603694.1 PorV/PorQ family protein [Bacteroidetes Order II. bacterium]MBT5248950.1 PorV/PorQ family protein [Bacteroidetes Order II. bacterium]MBT6200921.1 PorV/PorQ family protein [Bacteroidetes Order II. bacterium]
MTHSTHKIVALGVLLASLFQTGSVQAQNKVGTTAAAFLNIATDARAAAMGSAQVALAGGPNTVHWNPAALSRFGASGVDFVRSDWFVDSQFHHFSASVETPVAHIGLSVMMLDYGEMEVTTISNPEGTGELFNPKDISIGVSAARNITNRFSAGATVKYVQQKIWNEKASGTAFDLGVFYSTNFSNLRIGMSMTNFGSDLSLSGKDLRRAIDIEPNFEGNNPRLGAELETSAWPMPLTFRVGIALDPWSTETQRITIAMDAVHPNDNSESVSLGGEYSFREFFFIRAGYRQAFSDIVDDGGMTGGFGLAYRVSGTVTAHFDYVFQDYGDLGTPQMWTLGATF